MSPGNSRTLDNGESIDLDGFGLVVFAVGMRAQTDIFKETPLLKVGKYFVGGQALAETPVTDKIDIITLAIQHGLNAHDLAQFSYSAQPYQSFFPANNPNVHIFPKPNVS